MTCKKMLNIQKFIFEHDDWEAALQQPPYSLKIKRSSFADGRYVMFNYNMIESDNYDPIVAEARGLVLDSEEKFKIVRKGFNRFFNYGEGPAAKIDWGTANATIKEDGTLVFLSFYDGRWIFGTRQNFDVDEAEMSDAIYPTFGALLRDTIEKSYPEFKKQLESLGSNGPFTGNLWKKATYCFELCSRFNRIVIDYPKPKLFLIGRFRNEDGAELTGNLVVDGYVGYQLGVDTPTAYEMKSPEDYTNLVEGFGIQHEGVVVRDGNGNRVKMKSKLYFQLHKQMSNGAMDVEAMVGLIRKGEDAEFLSYFPEYAEKFDDVRLRVNAALMRIKFIGLCTKGEIEDDHLDRRAFALKHKDDPQSMLWFKAYDGKLTDDFVMSITDDKFIQLFGIE